MHDINLVCHCHLHTADVRAFNIKLAVLSVKETLSATRHHTAQ